MPFYGYRCDACELEFDVNKPMSESGTPEACPECEGETRKLVVPCGTVLKGDGWATKNNRVAGQMQKRREATGRRQEELKRDTNIGGRLVPNVGGERVDNWSEAGRLAADKGKDTSGYEQMAAKEKADQKRLNSKTR